MLHYYSSKILRIVLEIIESMEKETNDLADCKNVDFNKHEANFDFRECGNQTNENEYFE